MKTVEGDRRHGGVGARGVGEESRVLEAEGTTGAPAVMPEGGSAPVPKLHTGDGPVRGEPPADDDLEEGRSRRAVANVPPDAAEESALPWGTVRLVKLVHEVEEHAHVLSS